MAKLVVESLMLYEIIHNASHDKPGIMRWWQIDRILSVFHLEHPKQFPDFIEQFKHLILDAPSLCLKMIILLSVKAIQISLGYNKGIIFSSQER